MTHSRKILIIRPDHLGDVILSLPVAEALKNKYPDSLIIYFSAPGVGDLQGLVNYVDGWIVDQDDRGQRRSISSLVALLQGGRFDTLIELKPSWRTAIAGFLSHVQTRVGTSRRAYSIFYNHWVNLHRRASGRHQTDLDLALLKPLGIIVEGLQPNLKINDKCLDKAKSLLNIEAKSYIILHPGSGGSTTNWPIENYRKLAQMILQKTEYNVVITGNNDNIGIFEGCFDLNGKTDLEALAGVLVDARLFVSVGTGPLHLADALGIRCIAFFTNRPGIEPARWGPRRNMDNILVPMDIECRCSSAATCHCLEQVTPELAFNKLKDVLKESG